MKTPLVLQWFCYWIQEKGEVCKKTAPMQLVKIDGSGTLQLTSCTKTASLHRLQATCISISSCVENEPIVRRPRPLLSGSFAIRPVLWFVASERSLKPSICWWTTLEHFIWSIASFLSTLEWMISSTILHHLNMYQLRRQRLLCCIFALPSCVQMKVPCSLWWSEKHSTRDGKSLGLLHLGCLFLYSSEPEEVQVMLGNADYLIQNHSKNTLSYSCILFFCNIYVWELGKIYTKCATEVHPFLCPICHCCYRPGCLLLNGKTVFSETSTGSTTTQRMRICAGRTMQKSMKDELSGKFENTKPIWAPQPCLIAICFSSQGRSAKVDLTRKHPECDLEGMHCYQ